MGTAGTIKSWSLVRDNPCRCGNRACAHALRLAQERREAIADALEGQFDEPARSASLSRPLLLQAYVSDRRAAA